MGTYMTYPQLSLGNGERHTLSESSTQECCMAAQELIALGAVIKAIPRTSTATQNATVKDKFKSCLKSSLKCYVCTVLQTFQ